MQRNYLEDARNHEEVFRNILRSLNEKPEGLDLNAPLEEIFEEYSTGDRYGKWTILEFKMGPSYNEFVQLSENEALFASENIATLSGHGRVDTYRVKQDNSVEFNTNITTWMS